MFHVEIPKFLPHREVDFSIDLMLGEEPTSNTPYTISTLEFVELNLQLKKNA